jgi:diguanylate cyclase (GGDEF)-like protein
MEQPREGPPPPAQKNSLSEPQPAPGRLTALLGLGALLVALLVLGMLTFFSLQQLAQTAQVFSSSPEFGRLDFAIHFVRNLLWGALAFFSAVGLISQALLARLIDARNALEVKVRDRTADLSRANEQLLVSNQSLARQTGEIRSLNVMIDLLQAARSSHEAQEILSAQLPALFPTGYGGLYLVNASRNSAESAATWGDLEPVYLFPPDECWAIRLGRSHQTASGNPRCQHWLKVPPEWDTLCVPLVAGGETQGVLALSDGAIDPGRQDFAHILAEQLGLSIANLKLRETLRAQSIRDELTGLYNRRYFDETLDREISRCRRSSRELVLIMVDLDHFKRFNDEFGHKAGDCVLQSLAHALGANVRTSDVPCRYGGEEFALVLPDTPLAEGRERAEQIRHRILETRLDFDGRPLPSMTASFGVAVFPLHAQNNADLVRAADRALYQAKEAGRNRVVVAEAPASGGEGDETDPVRAEE